MTKKNFLLLPVLLFGIATNVYSMDDRGYVKASSERRVPMLNVSDAFERGNPTEQDMQNMERLLFIAQDCFLDKAKKDEQCQAALEKVDGIIHRTIPYLDQRPISTHPFFVSSHNFSAILRDVFLGSATSEYIKRGRDIPDPLRGNIRRMFNIIESMSSERFPQNLKDLVFEASFGSLIGSLLTGPLTSQSKKQSYADELRSFFHSLHISVPLEERYKDRIRALGLVS